MKGSEISTQTYRKKPVLAAAYLGIFLFGIELTTPGAILPFLMEKFAMNKIDAGSLMSLFSAGILIASLLFGPLVDRFGYKILLIISALLGLIGLEGLVFAPSFSALQVSVFLIGLGGGGLNGITSTLVADISPENRGANLSKLGTFFGIGAVSFPLLLSLLLKHLRYEIFFAITGILFIFSVGFYISTRFPVSKQAHGFPAREGLELLKKPLLLLFSCILFFQSGMEIIVGSWTPIFLKEAVLLPDNLAVFLVSMYWLGMTAGRFAYGYFLKSPSPATAFFCCMGIACSGVVILVFSHSFAAAFIALWVIGVGFSIIFPIIMGYIGDLFAHLSGTAFSIALVIALMGGMSLPFLIGVIADAYSLRISLLLIPICIGVSASIFLNIQKKLAYNKNVYRTF